MINAIKKEKNNLENHFYSYQFLRILHMFVEDTE